MQATAVKGNNSTKQFAPLTCNRPVSSCITLSCAEENRKGGVRITLDGVVAPGAHLCSHVLSGRHFSYSHIPSQDSSWCYRSVQCCTSNAATHGRGCCTVDSSRSNPHDPAGSHLLSARGARWASAWRSSSRGKPLQPSASILLTSNSAHCVVLDSALIAIAEG